MSSIKWPSFDKNETSRQPFTAFKHSATATTGAMFFLNCRHDKRDFRKLSTFRIHGTT